MKFAPALDFFPLLQLHIRVIKFTVNPTKVSETTYVDGYLEAILERDPSTIVFKIQPYNQNRTLDSLVDFEVKDDSNIKYNLEIYAE